MKTNESIGINPHQPPIDPPHSPHPPDTASDTLRSAQSLHYNDALVSRNGQVRLTLIANGNLVITRTGQAAPVWSSNTAGTPVAAATVRTDGSFACLDTAGHPYWSTQTSGHPGSRVTLQNDGNLIVYSPSSTVLWSSNSATSTPAQTHAQVSLDWLSCAKTTEQGHDEVYYLLIGKDGSGTSVSHRGPDASQGADADDQTAWDMNDSGPLMSRNLRAILCNAAVPPGQEAVLTFSFFQSDGQDWGSTVKAAAAVAANIGPAVPVVSVVARVLSWLDDQIPVNKDDALGAFGLTVANDNGKIAARDLHPGDHTRVIHPIDPATGAFTVHFVHDDGDYTASFRAQGV
jgi:hypothetical protein